MAFYLAIAERPWSLPATIPVAFRGAAKKRKRRRHELQLLLEQKGGGRCLTVTQAGFCTST